MVLSSHEKKIGDFYDQWYSKLIGLWGIEETLCYHNGLYGKGARTFTEAVYRMNDLVGTLLHLDNQKPHNILDAGSGLGGTSLYLAKHYPTSKFIGITIAPHQVELANFCAKERNIANASFSHQSYLNTSFSDNYFDGIFALESSSYAEEYHLFLDEMHRILKPRGTLVVIDGFRTDKPLNSFMEKLYDDFSRGFGASHLPFHSDYTAYLTKKGFQDIITQNISKQVRRSIYSVALVCMPFYFYDIIRRRLHIQKPMEDSTISFSRGVNISAGLLGLYGAIQYYATSAVKQ